MNYPAVVMKTGVCFSGKIIDNSAFHTEQSIVCRLKVNIEIAKATVQASEFT